MYTLRSEAEILKRINITIREDLSQVVKDDGKR